MKEIKIACPKCGYQNLPHRTTCKNCGEGLTEEARLALDVVSASQKRPVWTRADWLLAGLGVLFLVPMIYFGSTVVIMGARLQTTFLVLFIGISIGGLCGWPKVI